MLCADITEVGNDVRRADSNLARVGPCLAVSFGLAACGDDDDDASSVTSALSPSAGEPAAAQLSPKPLPSRRAAERAPASSAPESSAPMGEVCAARDDLSESVAALGDVSISNITSDGPSAITDALGEVREDLGAVGSAAGAEVRSQVRTSRMRSASSRQRSRPSATVATCAPPCRRWATWCPRRGRCCSRWGRPARRRRPCRIPLRRRPADQRRRLPAATMAANSSSVNGNTDSRLPLASRRELASSGIARSSSRGT